MLNELARWFPAEIKQSNNQALWFSSHIIKECAWCLNGPYFFYVFVHFRGNFIVQKCSKHTRVLSRVSRKRKRALCLMETEYMLFNLIQARNMVAMSSIEHSYREITCHKVLW